MNAHETHVFDNHQNQRAKLRNAWSMVNWYAYRFASLHGIPVTAPVQINGMTIAPKSIILELSEIWLRTSTVMPSELIQIIGWAWRFESTKPEKADDLFYSTWKFLTKFNQQLCLQEHK